MRISISRLPFIKNLGIYTMSSIINKAIPFLMLPILTRYMTTEEYGLVSMFSLLISFTSPFIGISSNGAVARQYYNQENINIKEYVWNSLVVLVITTLFTGTVYYFFASVISSITSFPIKMLWMVILYSFSLQICNTNLVLFQVQKNATLYGTYNIIKTLFNMCLSLILIVVFGLSWKGRLWGQLVAVVVFSIISIIFLARKKWIIIRFNKKYIMNIFNYGLPLIPHAIAGTTMSLIDRAFITNMVNLSATGIYTVGYQIGSIINIISMSFNNAYVPWLYEKLKQNKMKDKVIIVKYTYIYFVIMLLLAYFLGITAPFFLKLILDRKFHGASSYVVWVTLGYAFNAMYLMVVNYIFYAQKNSFLALVTFFSAIINTILNYFFIKSFGAIGAAQATTITFLIKFLLVWYVSARIYNMPWRDSLSQMLRFYKRN